MMRAKLVFSPTSTVEPETETVLHMSVTRFTYALMQLIGAALSENARGVQLTIAEEGTLLYEQLPEGIPLWM